MRTLLFFLLLLSAPALYAQDADIHEEVEQMPLFPGTETQAASSQALLTFVYANVTYPEAARKAEKSGMAVTEFVVERDGSLSNVAIYRDPGNGLGGEALRATMAMAEKAGAWSPGTIDGKPVRVRFKLPIKFALGSEK